VHGPISNAINLEPKKQNQEEYFIFMHHSKLTLLLDFIEYVDAYPFNSSLKLEFKAV
jgi:hypothetical protein